MLDQILQPTEPALLTYDFPDYTREADDYTAPPLEIKEDGDVELFMAVRVDYVWLKIYVTFGEENIEHYRRQKDKEDGERGYMVISEEVLRGICTPGEMEILNQSSLGLGSHDIYETQNLPINIESSEDSSDLPSTLEDSVDAGGMISLKE
ncbi:unnamed protein product [Eruca vesicaria subsp. sativa]|uniref:Uncharacterized protein n=1 Tax=Eruca vesicaria subsp. sativa TaxID=29727 RepID=A0ABC8IUR1_ERUVS|nr:unnamed protein product [Eruca vesicaria subsp. sativa]